MPNELKERRFERRAIQPSSQARGPERRVSERRGMPVPPMAGAIRPAPGEVVPRKERRRFPESGLE